MHILNQYLQGLNLIITQIMIAAMDLLVRKNDGPGEIAEIIKTLAKYGVSATG